MTDHAGDVPDDYVYEAARLLTRERDACEARIADLESYEGGPAHTERLAAERDRRLRIAEDYMRLAEIEVRHADLEMRITASEQPRGDQP